MTQNEVRKIFEDMLEGFKIGIVDVDGFITYCRMNVTFLEDEESELQEDYSIPTLVIKDKKAFYKKLFEFVNCIEKVYTRFCQTPPNFWDIDRDFDVNNIKALLFMIWFNATPQDFGNPVEFLNRYINFIKDKTFSKYKQETTLGKLSIQNKKVYNMVIKLQCYEMASDMETPYCFRFSIYGTDKEGKKHKVYELPRVLYGITEDENGEKVGYIYSIKDYCRNKNGEVRSCFNRVSQSLRRGVLSEETEEYISYAKVQDIKKQLKGLSGKERITLERKLLKIGEEPKKPTFCENISEVSPPFIISLFLTLYLMKKEGIKKIKVPDLLLTRYQNRLKRGSDYADDAQSRCTEQLIRTFRRFMFHCPNALTDIEFPGEFEESFMTVKLSNEIWQTNNPLLEELLTLVNGIENIK